MFILYNSIPLKEEELRLPLTNRAFQYNDGFFETMIMEHGRIRFWQDHLARMAEAAAALKIELFQSINADKLLAQLLQLSEQNNASNYGRIKVKVWRDGAGLYTPQTNAAAWLATAQQAAPPHDLPLQVGICKTVTTQPSPFSAFKGPNALVYVMAAHEKAQAQYDDMLLLSPGGAVAELISSNIFWFRENTLFTPALENGCINGIVRRNILRWAAAQAVPVVECCLAPAVLQDASVVFSANVTGIRILNLLASWQLPDAHPQLEKLRQALFPVVPL
ncbi:aminotransferase class IV [Pontibacter sp. 172403-2]|uniref:aminotransferase class IV n=1 Tax=Pontibacter rufus TaxID=2791028 RepID=UPI0018AFB3D3|nr:aminotransferase class IV [Pontibacter sp. 172403-2]MBF9253748.1 aminotransferase class IV [Pontibacter sp. 172403-2]